MHRAVVICRSLQPGLLFLLLFSYTFCRAQSVITLPIKELNGPNGFALDAAGNLYVANEPGKKVIRVINDSISEDILTSDSPDGLAFGNEGNLYVTNFYSGIILRKHQELIDTFATGIHTPADIKWDGKKYLYVSEYETGNIKRIDRRGKSTLFASGFKNPFGLTFDDAGNLYVANNSSGIINKVGRNGLVSFFAQIPGVVSYLAFSKKSNKIYIACFSCNTIYTVTKQGKAELLAGTGIAGDKDGLLQEAQFRQPNSIAVTDDGDIYVSEFTVNRIRKITKAER